MSFPWDKWINALKESINEGKSASQTSIYLSEISGIEVSRKACTGRARRMGLRFSNGSRKPQTNKNFRPNKPRKVKSFKAENQVVRHSSEGVDILDLNDRTCRFPLWAHNELANFRYCGCPVEGKSYCNEHRAICYTKSHN